MLTFYYNIEDFDNEINFFNQIDIGKKGLIGEQEIQTYSKNIDNKDLIQKIPTVLKENFHFYQNQLTITDFVAIVKEHSFWFQTQKEIDFAYYMFDVDSKGRFDLKDFKERFVKMSIKMNEEELKKVFNQFEEFDQISYTITQESFEKFIEKYFK